MPALGWSSVLITNSEAREEEVEEEEDEEEEWGWTEAKVHTCHLQRDREQDFRAVRMPACACAPVRLLFLRFLTPHSGAVMWQCAVIGYTLLVLCAAAPPPHINRLALFPDKSAWCEAKNITQIVGHTGCQPQSIQNRACLGQCFSYSVPNTFPQSTESLVHCDSCMPAQTQWEVVTLECPGSDEAPRVDKLVERILHCSCQSCSKEAGPEGALLQLYPSETIPEPPPLPGGDHAHHNTHGEVKEQQPQHGHRHTDLHAHTHTPAGG
ncbi:hypothetical protein SKAU_G00172360 [Synaphobranchus kaupii]|uniref:Neuroblastoma suppressor of tumorigenicity 1 n=1 Tax=Synaphobranchus kaupii TaxID=118154 RepID=A0A9Q1FKU8_SYNKA|nr:hypothetical protein SKAU_G00172360 [Synaphobranchus kaupii]